MSMLNQIFDSLSKFSGFKGSIILNISSYMITYVSPLYLLRDSQSLTLISLSRMDIINDFTQDEVSFLLDIVHEYYAKDDSVEPLIEKLWKLDRLLQIEDVRTDKAWRQA